MNKSDVTAREAVKMLIYLGAVVIMLFGFFGATFTPETSKDNVPKVVFDNIFNLSIFSFIVGTLALNAKFDLRKKEMRRLAIIPFNFILSGVLFMITFTFFGILSYTLEPARSLLFLIGGFSFFISVVSISGALILLLEYTRLRSNEYKESE